MTTLIIITGLAPILLSLFIVISAPWNRLFEYMHDTLYDDLSAIFDTPHKPPTELTDTPLSFRLLQAILTVAIYGSIIYNHDTINVYVSAFTIVSGLWSIRYAYNAYYTLNPLWRYEALVSHIMVTILAIPAVVSMI